MENIVDFTGKVVIVTGARSGIGQATAVTFARQGAKVVMAGRHACDETAAQIAEFGGECMFVECDVSKEEDVKNLVAKTIEAYGKLDIAVNNAGYKSPTDNLTEQTTQDFDNVMAIDVRGVFLCMKYEIPELLKQGEGSSIINIASVVATVADPGMAPYVAAKHAVHGLTQAAGIEYAEQGLRINCIGPADVATEMTIPWLENPEIKEMVKGFNAQHRIADPQEIADVCLFLASPRANKFISGALIAADGGQTAH